MALTEPLPGPHASFEQTTAEKRPFGRSLARGLLGHCPNCGRGAMFDRYLKVAPTCPSCGEDLSHHRADDAPPYFTIVIVGHIIVPLALLAEQTWHLSSLTHMMIWLPLTALLSLALLQPMKGMVVGLQWALRMHGFDQSGDIADPGASAWTIDDSPGVGRQRLP